MFGQGRAFEGDRATVIRSARTFRRNFLIEEWWDHREVESGERHKFGARSAGLDVHAKPSLRVARRIERAQQRMTDGKIESAFRGVGECDRVASA